MGTSSLSVLQRIALTLSLLLGLLGAAAAQERNAKRERDRLDTQMSMRNGTARVSDAAGATLPPGAPVRQVSNR